MSDTLVSCRQIAPVVGEARGNRDAIIAEARAAAAEGARIVVFPELAASGYSFRDVDELQALAEPRDGELLLEWQGLAEELDIMIVAGYAELDPSGTVFNSAVIVDATGVLAHYRKVHLWDFENELFTAGEELPPVIDTKFGRIGLLICYDLEFPEWVRTLALRGTELLCAPVNWPLYPRPEGERPTEVVKVQASASVNRMAIAACDRSGEDRGQLWVGGSTIVDADGYPLALAKLGAPGSCTAALNINDSRNKMISERNHVLHDRRPHLYTSLVTAETADAETTATGA